MFRDLARGLRSRLSPGLRTPIRFQSIRIPDEARDFLRANPAYVEDYPLIRTVEETYFRGRIADDWETIRSFVPADTRSVLDIGCGVAGIQIPLYHALTNPQIHIVDKGVREQSGRTFNVIEAARELLVTNGVPAADLHVFDAHQKNTQARLEEKRFDFILSTRGLAFMFPYGIYRDLINKTLRPGGVLILDLMKIEKPNAFRDEKFLQDRFDRRGEQDSEDVMETIAKDLDAKPEIIFDTPRMRRIRVRRQSASTS